MGLEGLKPGIVPLGPEPAKKDSKEDLSDMAKYIAEDSSLYEVVRAMPLEKKQEFDRLLNASGMNSTKIFKYVEDNDLVASSLRAWLEEQDESKKKGLGKSLIDILAA